MTLNGYIIKPRANLQGANLRQASLQGADLRQADLQGADLQGADLQEADLLEANLQEANLQEANLRKADLQGADLQGANLQWADLRGANLRGADLRGASLDFSSGIPFWCGGQGIKMDARQLRQVVAHAFAMDSDAEPEYQKLREACREFASQSHIAKHLDWLNNGRRK